MEKSINITLTEETLCSFEEKLKDYFNGKRALSLKFELENVILRSPGKHGEDEFLKDCFLEHSSDSKVEVEKDSFKNGAMCAYYVLKKRYYESREHFSSDEI